MSNELPFFRVPEMSNKELLEVLNNYSWWILDAAKQRLSDKTSTEQTKASSSH